VNNPSSYQLS